MGTIMTVFLLSLAGFPGTAGFIAKYNLLLGAAEARLWVLSVILVLTTVVSYWYYLRVAWFMWMKEEAPEETAGTTPAEAFTPFATPRRALPQRRPDPAGRDLPGHRSRDGHGLRGRPPGLHGRPSGGELTGAAPTGGRP